MKKLLFVALLFVPSLVLAGKNPITSADITESQLEYRNYMGELMISSVTVSLAASASTYFVIDLASNTVTKDVYCYFEVTSSSGNSAGMTLNVYKDVVTNSSGTLAAVLNQNTKRSVSRNSLIYVAGDINTPGTILNGEKIYTYGNAIFSTNLPMILKDGQGYLVLLTNNNVTSVDTVLKIKYYESK